MRRKTPRSMKPIGGRSLLKKKYSLDILHGGEGDPK